MDSLTALAASGMQSRMESLDLLANNVANASTGGFKADREFYSLYMSPEAALDSDSAMPVIERPWTDMAQGLLEPTGNPLDLALDGKGFFAVAGPSGALYTRNGSFRLSKTGSLVTAEGYPLAEIQGKPLRLDGTLPIDIDPDGTVRQEGAVIGQLQIVDFPGGGEGFSKQGASYFRQSDPKANPSAAAATVAQGKIEGSNSGSAGSAVRMIGIMRQFEMLQKAASMGNDMNKQAIEQVARVGS